MSLKASALDALAKWGPRLLDLFYPPYCVACGQTGAWLCARCVGSITPLNPPLCARCGAPLTDRQGCVRCCGSESLLAGVRSMAIHRYPLQQAIHALKYEGVKVLADLLSVLLADFWRTWAPPATVVVPVPLHQARLRERGYNQSLLLAQAFARHTGLVLRADPIVRERNTRSQVGLAREERWNNVWGAFRGRSAALEGECVLLLDDVLTTGATLESCASALREAGAQQIWALTLTRAADQDIPVDTDPRRSHS